MNCHYIDTFIGYGLKHGIEHVGFRLLRALAIDVSTIKAGGCLLHFEPPCLVIASIKQRPQAGEPGFGAAVTTPGFKAGINARSAVVAIAERVLSSPTQRLN